MMRIKLLLSAGLVLLTAAVVWANTEEETGINVDIVNCRSMVQIRPTA